MDKWFDILSAEQLADYWARAATHDQALADHERAWWEDRTPAQLMADEMGSFFANQAETYQLARSYRALAEAR